MTDFITWTFIIRMAFRVLELELEASERADWAKIDGEELGSIMEQMGGVDKFGKLGELILSKKHEFFVRQKAAEADGSTVDILADLKHTTVNQVTNKMNEIRPLEDSLRESYMERDKAVEELARMKMRQANDLLKFRDEFLPRITDIEKRVCTFTQETVSGKTDPATNFDALASLKRLFVKLGGVTDYDTPGINLEAGTIAFIGAVVALAVLQSGFTVPALMEHAKKEFAKDSYTAIKKTALYFLVSLFGVQGLKSEAKKPSMLVVFMDGDSVGQPIEMKACNDYKSLCSAIEALFLGVGAGLMDGTSKYEILCENKDDLLFRVGGVSWQTFISNDIKRLIVKKKPMEGVGVNKDKKSSEVLAELAGLKESIISVGSSNVEATLSPKWKAFKTIIFRERDDGLYDSEKIAAFDFDGCLADTSVKRTGPDAWSLMYPSIPEKLQGLHDDGYKLVIFANESNIERWKNKRQEAVDSKIGRLENFLNTLKVPIQVFIACGLGKSKDQTEDPFRKPKPGMWRLLEKHFNSGIAIDMEQSFYVGDAAGRANDHSDAGIIFAKELGLKFHLSEDFFGATEVSQS